MKLHGIKLHTPSFHIGDRKYKVGNYANFYVGYSNGKIRGHYRQGWRQHNHDDYDSSEPDYRSGDVVGLLRPISSARVFFTNQARNEYV